MIFIWLEYKHNPKQIIIFILGIAAFMIAYTKIGDFNERINDTLALISDDSQSLATANISSQTIIINLKIALKSFADSCGLGGGIGSHPISYERFIKDLPVSNVVFFFNKEDANSLLLRIISELGLLGLAGVVGFLFRFWPKRDGTFESIVGNMCITYFFLRLLRYTIVVPQGVSGPLYIAVTPVAFGYYLAGNLIHKAGRILKDKQIGEKITGKGNIVLLLVSCALITVLSLYNKPVLMYENSYGNVLISLVTAFIGYYVLSDMAKLMHENAFLQWCGKNSIIVYVVHFSIVQGTRGILVRLLPLPMEILGWIVFVVAVLIVLAVGKICERHFMFAFGK